MAKALLELRGLRKAFGALKASDGVDLTLLPGEIHALIGPNGAGKSTLIAQVAGFLRPDAGEIRLLGQNVSALSVAARARMGLGRTFQVSSLAPELSALTHVLLAQEAAGILHGSAFWHFWRFWARLGKDAVSRTQAMEVLGRVGLEPERASVSVSALSHGERRLVEIAAALAMQPKLLLLDEPMAGLGPEGSRHLTTFLQTLKADAGILLIEHDMDAVFALADRISVLVYGRILATDTPEEIRQSEAVREAYLGDGSC